MVDALRRAHQIVSQQGTVVDLHPSAAPAFVEVGDDRVGTVDAGDAPVRHASAGLALARVVEEGLFTIEQSDLFTFYTYGDTIEELREYVVENWRNGRISGRTVERARDAVRRLPGVRPRVHERVHITKLRPTA